jgi:hypothetical protein
MLPRFRLFAAFVAVAFLADSLSAAPLTDSLTKGTPELKSAGALTFGPEGILFVADPTGGSIFAIETGDAKAAAAPIKVEGLKDKLASLLGTEAKALLVNDMAVNPQSGKAYLSISRGTGPDAKPAIVRIDSKGAPELFDLKDVKFASVKLPNTGRANAITDLAYGDGKVVVAGMSSEEFASTLRIVAFPFKEADKGTGVEIYHGAHGKFETASPVRTLTLYDVKGETNVLGAYQCTPLVRFPISDLKPGQKIKGTTIAELGNGNAPLDMVVYEKDGKNFILIANNRRGVMKVTTDNIATQEGIVKKVAGTEGLKYETISSLKDVKQLDRLDKTQALVLIEPAAGGAMRLETVELP